MSDENENNRRDLDRSAGRPTHEPEAPFHENALADLAARADGGESLGLSIRVTKGDAPLYEYDTIASASLIRDIAVLIGKKLGGM